MKHHRLALAFTLCGLLLPSTGRTETANSPASSNAGVQDAEPVRLPRWLRLGAVIRGRFEDPSGMNFTPEASDAYYLSRVRLNLTLSPTSWLRFYAEGQDARVFGYNDPTQPANMHNALDLRQGYAEFGTEGQSESTFAWAGRS